jgi:hypothetical protein
MCDWYGEFWNIHNTPLVYGSTHAVEHHAGMLTADGLRRFRPCLERYDRRCAVNNCGWNQRADALARSRQHLCSPRLAAEQPTGEVGT